ncbi:MAG: DegQ family serine endoprotease [Gammaproteobacteria bacterium]|nr:DegQ family serine endoprotease [Gammaproteobacteria bacterium]NIR85692.1 DegQ family serine endoprotease [Gammaproteobacteria bacterium]NIR90225.1 DegQ family serine endoprotease [Gammaproteobacteria bacterium]NIU06826.1 DegQ family serine endoprotease [Gammaproteobacteria bacterium]NIV53759.1 Do family serine endopeptidase [Gammaproteobacteria bacterium]
MAALLSVSHAAGAQSLPDFTRLVEQYGQAVVNISTTQKRTQARSALPKGFEIPDVPEDSPFYDFFRRFFGEGEIEEYDAESLGSGFIISTDGYVITNNHVIKNADEIIVRLNDRRELTAELVGADERSDIALLKLEAENLPMVQLGTDYDLRVGEWVLAIGSPFGFDHSVTAGIVSAKERSLPRDNYVPFIQTDVAINPGNSGGPLFNLDGQVVGVNSQIFSRTGGFMGLSFAIPIDVAMDVVQQLKTKGYVTRGWLGVLIQDVTRELAESFGMERPEGALIAKVLPDSPAEQAGLRVGDIVLRFDEREVEESSDLPPIVGSTRVGREVPVEILREGRSRSLEVTIGELPAEEDIKLAAESEDSPADNKLNMAVSDLTREQREEYGLEDENHGVLVTQVDRGPAQRAGIREGDVVLMLNSVKVRDSEHFRTLAAELPDGKAISVLVQRGGNPIFLALKTEGG